MGSKKNKDKRYQRKRKFYCNQFVSNKKDSIPCGRLEDGVSRIRSTSNKRKTEAGDLPGTPPSTKRVIGYPVNEGSLVSTSSTFMLINSGVLKTIIGQVGTCPVCSQRIDIEEIQNERMGFCSKVKIFCLQCDWSVSNFLSEEVQTEKGSRGRKFFEVNLRAVIAFREMGKGHEGLNTFARLMNMKGITWASYKNINNAVFDAYESVAEESMRKVALHIKEDKSAKKHPDNPSVTLCDVSIDGTWQRRGYSSLNGVVTAVSHGKCLDRHVMSKYCKACVRWESRKGTRDYSDWIEKHVCHVNHMKSSGAMESAGAVAIFSSSVEKHSLIYSSYLGDGDTSAFKDVLEANPYKEYGILPSKLECIGHVQKRLGTRLRELRKQHKNTSNSLTGRGKLTDKIINQMQNYYGLAIRQNQGELYKMKKTIGAVLWHCSEFVDETFRHRFCPTDANTWCKWQLDRINGGNKYRKRVGIPIWIHDLVRPIFQDLSSDELLSKCLHGKTQNLNEAINHVIWQKCPKNIFVQRDVLEMAVNSAIISFNEGPLGIQDVLKRLNICPGACFEQTSVKCTKARVKDIQRKSSEKEKNRRKKLRSIRKGFLDKEQEVEGEESYKSGGH